MRGLPFRVLFVLVIVALGIALVFSYGAVISQNPHASTKPLYGPSDFAQVSP
jgi:uncharacterized ion transporter superfamily protein YfcC